MEEPAYPQQEGPQNRDQEITLDQITKECLDSPGYIMFVGTISRNRDEKGFNLINFKYRRYNFTFEDTKRAVEEFKQKYLEDVQSI